MGKEMKERRCHGYRIEVMNNLYWVKFNYFNNKVVKAFVGTNDPAISDEYCGCGNCRGEIEFIGISKCSPEDKFDKVLGEKIALGKALDKLFNYYEKKAMEACDVIERNREAAIEAIQNRFDKYSER